MIVADLLYQWTQIVLVDDTWVGEACRWAIAITSGVQALLLAKLYWQKKTGRMPVQAAVGAVLTYMVVAWAQLIAIDNPATPQTLTTLNLSVLFAVVMSLWGTATSLHIRLFRRG